MISALIGTTLAFLVARLVERKFLEQFLQGRWKDISDMLQNNGFMTILILRIVLIVPFEILNYLSGLSRIRFKDFFLGTLFGMMPGAIVTGLIGGSLGEINSLGDILSPKVLLGAALIVLFIGVPGIYYYLKIKGTKKLLVAKTRRCVMNISTPDGGWSPYFAGTLVGVLAVVSVIFTTNIMGKTNFLGASTTFVRAAGLLESSVAASHVNQNEYFKKEKVKVDWQFMLVLGILIGAFLASLSDKSFKLESLPPTWAERFGASVPLRAVWAFAGGAVAMIGARLADGCPSGHGLSGLMQLSLSGFAALAFFFGTGVIVANFVYRRRVS